MTTIDKAPQWIDKPLGQGSKPAPLEYTFTDDDGAAITGSYTATFQLRKPDGTSTSTSASWNSSTGAATFILLDTHLDQAGYYFAQFWIDNGTNKFDGDVLAWEVTEPIYQT